MVRILFIALAGMSLACAGLWVVASQLKITNSHLESSNARLNDDVSQYEITLQSKNNALQRLKKSTRKRNELITKQHQENQSLLVQLDQKKGRLNALISTVPVVKDWASQPVPDDITKLLSSTTKSSG